MGVVSRRGFFHDERQLVLFADLPPAEPQPRPKRSAGLLIGGQRGVQIEIMLAYDLDTADYPVRLFTRAADRPRPATTAPMSIFAMAMATAAEVIAERDTEPSPYPSSLGNVRIVTRDIADGVVRCRAIRFADSEEGQEKERERRARQKPPRPPKQRFKMKNSREWTDGT